MSMNKITKNVRRAANALYRSCMDIAIKSVFWIVTE